MSTLRLAAIQSSAVSSPGLCLDTIRFAEESRPSAATVEHLPTTPTPRLMAFVSLDNHHRLIDPILIEVTTDADGVTVADKLISRFGEGEQRQRRTATMPATCSITLLHCAPDTTISARALPGISEFSKIVFRRSEPFVAEYDMRRVRQQFTSKLQAAEEPGKRHDKFIFQDDTGVTVGVTGLSRGQDSVSLKNLSFIASELGVQLNVIRGAIDCRVSRTDFLDLLRNSPAP